VAGPDGRAHGAVRLSSAKRLFALLDRFTEQAPVWDTDALISSLGCPRATAYRALKTLVDAGLLVRLAAGRYGLGPRIVQLDWQLRSSDPLLHAAIPVMDGLARSTGLDAVLSVLMGDHLIDTHRAGGASPLILAYGRGRPRPLVLGAAPRVLLAHQPLGVLRRLHARRAEEIARCGMGQDWAQFRTRLAQVRETGWSVSRGELETHLGAVAVPVVDEEGTVRAALALVGPPAGLEAPGVPSLVDALVAARDQLRLRLGRRPADSGGAAL
jgi:DNA-binding IclR family transcriptional regulator